MLDEQRQLLEQIEGLFQAADTSALGQLLNEQRSSDIAEIVELLDNEQRRTVFDLLQKASSAEVLEKVSEATRDELFELLTENEINSLFSELDLDDAADLLAELPDEVRQKVLRSFAPAESAQIEKLMTYSEDSAGGIMDPMVISVPQDATVAEAISKIRAAEIDEDFYSVFVVDKTGRFVGDVRLRYLLTSPEDTLITDLVDHDAFYVAAEDDQERVRNVFRDNDLIVVPVLDNAHRLVGRITADRVIEVADEEAAEDLYAMAGTDPDELEHVSVLHAAGVRMTWLLPCLFGTGITAFVLILFNKKFSLEDMALIYTAAIAFAPMVAAISGNAGLQTSAIVVSGLATGHLAALRLSQVFTREVRIALIVAVACAFIAGSVSALLLHFRHLQITMDPLRIVFALGFAMFAAIMVATTLGLFLPFLFRRIGIDPAISAGPLVTTANDSISVAIYMTLTLLLAGSAQ
ncbi:MAG TPA: magnesium transporter [Sedimentisphaerales bacterium]|nr:magnesium transporter [Sedimentisphaerales bacterium]